MIGGPDRASRRARAARWASRGRPLTAGVHVQPRLPQRRQPLGRRRLPTGNKDVAIRDCAINHNPLNYSDIGFDTTGVEVHADGEIWNSTNWSVRQALVEKWDKQFPYDNRALQLRCAQATATRTPLPPSRCRQPQVDPAGVRRVPCPAGCDVDARRPRRDARGGPDAVRRQGPEGDVGRVRQPRHGQGRLDTERRLRRPGADFASPRSRNAVVRFAGSKGRHGSTWVTSRRARRRSPTRPRSRRRSAARSGSPPRGRYEMLAVSRARGFKRFTVTVHGASTARSGSGCRRTWRPARTARGCWPPPTARSTRWPSSTAPSGPRGPAASPPSPSARPHRR